MTKLFRKKDAKFWIQLIQDIFIDTPKVYIKGIPSKAKQEMLVRFVRTDTKKGKRTSLFFPHLLLYIL